MTEDTTTEAPYLVYEFERRAYPLSDGTFTIGRDAESNIVLREPTVSRAHAEIRTEGDGDAYFIHAKGAAPTRLNGSNLSSPRELTDGDRIEIGSAEFTFRRGRLPLGVSIVDLASPIGHDPDVTTRRVTIANPILGANKSSPEKKTSATGGTLVLVILLGLAAVYYFIMR